MRHVHLVIPSADHTPTTLIGSCGPDPGITCRLVWNLTHNGRAAELTNNFLNGPVQVLLRVAFVILLAFVIRAIVHRVINRLTEHAAQSFLPQLKNGVAGARLVPSRLARRRSGAPEPDAYEAGEAEALGEAAAAEAGSRTGLPAGLSAPEAAAVAEAEDSVPAERSLEVESTEEAGAIAPRRSPSSPSPGW